MISCQNCPICRNSKITCFDLLIISLSMSISFTSAAISQNFFSMHCKLHQGGSVCSQAVELQVRSSFPHSADACWGDPLRVLVVQALMTILKSVAPCYGAAAELVNFCSAVYQLSQIEKAVDSYMMTLGNWNGVAHHSPAFHKSKIPVKKHYSLHRFQHIPVIGGCRYQTKKTYKCICVRPKNDQ